MEIFRGSGMTGSARIDTERRAAPQIVKFIAHVFVHPAYSITV